MIGHFKRESGMPYGRTGAGCLLNITLDDLLKRHRSEQQFLIETNQACRRAAPVPVAFDIFFKGR